MILYVFELAIEKNLSRVNRGEYILSGFPLNHETGYYVDLLI